MIVWVSFKCFIIRRIMATWQWKYFLKICIIGYYYKIWLNNNSTPLKLFFEKVFVFSKNLHFYSVNFRIKIFKVMHQMRRRTVNLAVFDLAVKIVCKISGCKILQENFFFIQILEICFIIKYFIYLNWNVKTNCR